MALYLITNGPAPTTAAHAAVTTGTAIKTLLQAQPKKIAKVVEWGISFDGSAAATPIKVELLETDVAATVTAHTGLTIANHDNISEGAADALTLGTGATGYTASSEGSITATRMLDAPQFIAPTSQFIKQFPLGREPKINKDAFARIRVHAPAAVNAYAHMLLEI